MPIYNISDVFNESNIPVLTFVEPREFSDIVGSILTTGKHITLSGPSGCGKTTLARKALDESGRGPGDTHWISGRDYASHESLESIFSKEFSCTESTEEITEYLGAAGIVILDDFHHLKEKVRNNLGYRLKRWHEIGIRFFVIGIASSSKKMLDIDSELGIRNDVYEMKKQDDLFCANVVSLGEKHLNIEFTEHSKRQFIDAANGIPSAIQVICRVACIRNRILKTMPALVEINCSMEEIKDGILRIYRGKYHNKLVGLCKGKQQARSVHNTYFDIIKNIAVIGKSEIQLQELQQRLLNPIDDLEERAKKRTSYHNCLKYLPEVIEERGLDDAIYLNKDSESISIEDPSFGLYLTLIDMEEVGKAIRLRRTGFAWDVAVSFAGEDRPIVEQLKDILNDAGYTVFYDFDVQHQLWGADLRLKLADVYANDAQYMIVFLSKYYPEKDWTNFELEVGREARGKRTEIYLLPVVMDDVHVIGLSQNVGYIDLRRCSVGDLANTMIEKIENG